MADKYLLTIEEAAEQLSIGRTKLRTLINDGELASVYIGRCHRIPAVEVTNYVQRLQEDAGTTQTSRRRPAAGETQQRDGRGESFGSLSAFPKRERATHEH